MIDMEFEEKKRDTEAEARPPRPLRSVSTV